MYFSLTRYSNIALLMGQFVRFFARHLLQIFSNVPATADHIDYVGEGRAVVAVVLQNGVIALGRQCLRQRLPQCMRQRTPMRPRPLATVNCRRPSRDLLDAKGPFRKKVRLIENNGKPPLADPIEGRVLRYDFAQGYL